MFLFFSFFFLGCISSIAKGVFGQRCVLECSASFFFFLFCVPTCAQVCTLDYSWDFVLKACHGNCACVCAGIIRDRPPPGFFTASLFIAAQKHAQLKTYDIIRMTDNILSADKVISM